MGHKIKLVSIDGDGCLFAYTNVGSVFHSSWDALGLAYGLKEIWDERTNKYYKKGDFDKQWAEEDIAELTGKDIKQSEHILYPIPYSPGVEEFLDFSKGKLVRGLLSTCVDIVGKKASEEKKLDFCFCNILNRNNGNFSGTIDYLVPTWQKHLKIPDLCKKFGVMSSEICHVGDNENDISVGERVGMFVAYNPKKKEVANRANHTIYDFRDLIKILDIK